VNAARRARKRANKLAGGGHSLADHVSGQRCPLCRPPAASPEQRMHLEAGRIAGRAERAHVAALGVAETEKIFSRKAKKPRTVYR
jgi:hypothetical protein